MELDSLIIIGIIAFSIFTSINKNRNRSKKGFFASIIEELEKETKKNRLQLDFNKLEQMRQDNKSVEHTKAKNENFFDEPHLPKEKEIQNLEKDEYPTNINNKNHDVFNNLKNGFIFKELIDKPRAFRKGHR